MRERDRLRKMKECSKRRVQFCPEAAPGQAAASWTNQAYGGEHGRLVGTIPPMAALPWTMRTWMSSFISPEKELRRRTSGHSIQTIGSWRPFTGSPNIPATALCFLRSPVLQNTGNVVKRRAYYLGGFDGEWSGDRFTRRINICGSTSSTSGRARSFANPFSAVAILPSLLRSHAA